MKSRLILITTVAIVLIVPAPSQAQELSTSDIYDNVLPSIVMIRTDSGAGTGFIIESSGVIATALHVVEDAEQVQIETESGDIFDTVQLMAQDERRDIALLKVAGFDLPFVALGNSNSVSPGDRLIVVGNPLGLEELGGSISEGIVSGVRDLGAGYEVIQTDAAISPGHSGSPVLDATGNAVGVVSFRIVGGESLNFAIPINYVRGLQSLQGSAPLVSWTTPLELPETLSLSSNKFDNVYRAAMAVGGATTAGVTYQQFGELLQSLATETEIVADMLLTDEEREVAVIYSAAQRAYLDSRTIWSKQLDNTDEVWRGNIPLQLGSSLDLELNDVVERYGITVTQLRLVPTGRLANVISGQSVQIVWTAASLLVEMASGYHLGQTGEVSINDAAEALLDDLNERVESPKAGVSTVYFYRRGSFWDSALNPTVACDDIELARFEKNQFFTIELENGIHDCWMIGFAVSGRLLSFNVVEDEVYFVRYANSTFGGQRLEFVDVEQAYDDWDDIKPIESEAIKHSSVGADPLP